MNTLGLFLTEALVFGAVAWAVWVIAPLLVAAGLERSTGKYVTAQEAAFDPLYRFTTPERLLQACWGVAILCGGAGVAFLLFAGVDSMSLLLGAWVLVGTVAFQVPRLIVKGRIRRRNELFHRRLVDVTLGLASGLRAGAALPQTLQAITRDLGGPVGEEFAMLLHEHQWGNVALPECLARLGKRMPGEDLQLLITAVKLTLDSGGSLAEVLEKITFLIRQRVEFHERLQTLTAQGRFEAIAMASAPAVAFGLLYLVDHDLMMPLVTTRSGWLALAVVFVMETIGFLWIRRIVNVEV